ncbi:MAG: hypothetical protein ACEQR5_02005 [Moraxellaceae bacterium]
MDYSPINHNHADLLFSKGHNAVESIFYQRPKNDLENYITSNVIVTPIMNILSEISKENYTNAVLYNGIHLIEKLPVSFLVKLNVESFYKSKYNTLIIDFEDESTCLTIDIGSKSFGYFIEKENNVVDFKESLLIETKEESQVNYGILNQAIINHIL